MLFTLFKKLFKRNVSVTRPPKHFSRTIVQTERTQPVLENNLKTKPDVAPQVKKTQTLVTKTPATVLVKFIDKQQKELRPQLILKGFLGDSLKLTIPNLSGYLLQKIDGMSSKISAPKQTITVHYQSALGQPVMIYCFDYDTNQLLGNPQFMTGPLTQNYHVPLPKIAGYQLHFSIGNQTGTYTHEPQNVILYYRRNDWKIVQPVNYLVKIKASTLVYQDPITQTQYDFKLPTGSVWKVFKEVHTNQGTWLSLGGAEWVKQDYVSRINDPIKKIN